MKKKKAILAVTSALIVLGVVGCTTESGTVKDVTPTTNTTENQEENASQNLTENETENSEDTVKTDFAVGEIAELNNVQVSVLGFEESSGSDWSKPEDGKIFVYANIEITNNSDEEISVSSMLNFETYCGDYKLEYSSNALMAADDRQQMDGSVAPGKKLNGYLGLEVPSDWNNIEIHYKDNAWLDSNFKFILTK